MQPAEREAQAEAEAEAELEEGELDPAQGQQEPAAPVIDDSPLQQCAEHREHSSAACVRCPDCSMRCKRCRVAKPLSDFKLVFKAKEPGAAVEPYLKATCQACRGAAIGGAAIRTESSAIAEASNDGLPPQRSSQDASGAPAAVQQREEAAPVSDRDRAQQQETPDPARLRTRASRSNAASEPERRGLPVAAGTPVDAPADRAAQSVGRSQEPPAAASPEPCSAPDSPELLEQRRQQPQQLQTARSPTRVRHQEAAAPAEAEDELAAAGQATLGADDATSALAASPAATEVQEEEESSDAKEAALHGTEAAGGQQKQQQHRQDGAAAEDGQPPVRASTWLVCCLEWFSWWSMLTSATLLDCQADP